MIVDTTVWVDYLNGISTPEVKWFDRESERQRLGLLRPDGVRGAPGRLDQCRRPGLSDTTPFRDFRHRRRRSRGGRCAKLSQLARSRADRGRPSIASSRRSVSSTRMRCSTAIAISTASRTSPDWRSCTPEVQNSHCATYQEYYLICLGAVADSRGPPRGLLVVGRTRDTGLNQA